jgi:hypothetical protein
MRCSEMIEIYDDMERNVGACGRDRDLSVMSEDREHKERGEKRVASGDGHEVFKS